MRYVLLILSVSLSAHAYVTPDGDRTRWPAAPTIGLTTCSADVAPEACRAAIRAAAAQWQSPDLMLPVVRDGQAQLTIGFVADRPDLTGVLGVTTTTTAGQGVDRRIIGADVMLNDDFDWSIDGPRGTFHVQSTAAHEIGHALGLAHSPHRGATMYWHYDAEGASLAEDDRRGLRFLYGDRAGLGVACDQCVLPADCASGVCLSRPDDGGRGFCADRCAPDRTCSAGESCIDLNDGGTACVPDAGFCGDGGGLQPGEYCWGPFQCGPLRCAVFPGDARCAKDCDDDAAACDSGTVCMLDPVDLPRVCLPAGAAELGAECAWATDCASGVCLPTGVCGQRCAPACPDGWRCAPWQDANVCWPVPVADMDVADVGAADMVVDRSAPDLGDDRAVLDIPSMADASMDRSSMDMTRPDATPDSDRDEADGCGQTPPDDRSFAWLWMLFAVGCKRLWRRHP